MINLGSDIFFGQCYDAFWRKYLKKLGLALIRATRIGHLKKNSSSIFWNEKLDCFGILFQFRQT